MRPRQAIAAAPWFTSALLLGFGADIQAQAQGFSVNLKVSETLDYTDNAGMSAVSPGTTLTSSTSLALKLLSETDVSSFGLTTSGRLYLARNPDGSTATELGYPSLGLSYSDETASSKFTASANYSVSPAGDGTSFVVDDEDDDGIITPDEVTVLLTDARKTSYGLRLGYRIDLTARDSLNLRATASVTDFSGNDPDLIPSDKQSLRIGWNHDFADDLSGGVALSGNWFSNEDVIPTKSLNTTLSGNIRYEVNSAMSVAANFGISNVDLEDTSGGSNLTSFSGGASADFALADGSFGADFDFGVKPTEGGDLRRSASLGFSYSKEINDAASYSLALDLSASGDLDGSFGSGDRTISFSPVYHREIGRDLNADVGYRYEHKIGSGSATSHGIFLGLSKNFELLK